MLPDETCLLKVIYEKISSIQNDKNCSEKYLQILKKVDVRAGQLVTH